MSKQLATTPAKTVTEKACAKINLALHVTGRREDGYHLLDSLVVFADYGDDLILSEALRTDLEISGPFSKGLEAETDNLILKAHRVLSDALKTQVPPTHFHLIKNLPVSSGIGGGSADAAAALRGLIKLRQLEIDDVTLSMCAQKLGADVPVCLLGHTCPMQGASEIIRPIENFTPLYIVLVNAGVKISTPSIFAELGIDAGRSAFDGLAPYDHFKPIQPHHGEHTHNHIQWIDWLKNSRNDLQNAAMRQSNKISQTLEAINNSEHLLFARMSGSGATCFGLYASLDDAKNACATIKQSNPNWWVVASQLV